MEDDKANNIKELHSKVLQACDSNNIKDIQIILHSDCYPQLTQAEKEIHVFKTTVISIKYSSLGYDVLKYLILDYGIQEDNSFNKFTTKEADELFSKRKFNEELRTELEDSGKTNKKVKV